jgi:hypothetical protein
MLLNDYYILTPPAVDILSIRAWVYPRVYNRPVFEESTEYMACMA